METLMEGGLHKLQAGQGSSEQRRDGQTRESPASSCSLRCQTGYGADK